jgi:hypothetical protein
MRREANETGGHWLRELQVGGGDLGTRILHDVTISRGGLVDLCTRRAGLMIYPMV